MERRKFLKSLAAIPVVAILPMPALTPAKSAIIWSDFQPDLLGTWKAVNRINGKLYIEGKLYTKPVSSKQIADFWVLAG